jgi:hypothetical protein
MDLKPLFLWAKERGDANIYDRILIKIIPFMLKENIHLTAQQIEELPSIDVSLETYQVIVPKIEELLNTHYEEVTHV